MYIQSPQAARLREEMAKNRTPLTADIRAHTMRYVGGALFTLGLLIYFLISTNLLPTPLQSADTPDFPVSPIITEETPAPTATDTRPTEKPTRVVIAKAGVDSTIYNPAEANEATLDQYLTKGAVRYPGSGYPGSGNLFLFGHSTSFKVVRNPAYKTFNNVQHLKAGDAIDVYAGSTIHRYAVRSIEMVSADEAFVPFSYDKTMLTIVTCNTLGEKSDRFMVKAEYVGIVD